MKKRHVWKALLALSLVFLSALTGCSSNQSASSPSQDATAAPPKEGGTLVIANFADAFNLDPHFIGTLIDSNFIHHKVYETLVQYDKNLKFKPMLATEWKQLDDLTWEFKLRQGVTFHDGTPFNAMAVKRTIDRVLDPKVTSPQSDDFEMIQEIKVVDDNTVHFILKYPFAPLLSILASMEGSMFSPKAIDEMGKKLAQHPVGTGPFVFESWTKGQEIKLVKNQNYWGEKPKVDGVVFKVVPEDVTRVAMVETGEAHIAAQIPVTEIERVQASDTMSLFRTEGTGVQYISFNVKKKPFDDPRVRQAIAHAIEKEAVIIGVYNNVGKVAISPLSPKVFGYTPDVKQYEYDINKAKALLAEAGYPNGFKTTFMTDDERESVNFAEVIQSQLKGIGIDVQVQMLEAGVFWGEALPKGQHEMAYAMWGNATADGDYNQSNVFHTKGQGTSGNTFFYSNPEVDRLIDEARKEKDDNKRKEYYHKTVGIEMNDLPMVPIRNVEYVYAISKNLKGLWVNHIGYVMVNDVTIQ